MPAVMPVSFRATSLRSAGLSKTLESLGPVYLQHFRAVAEHRAVPEEAPEA
jgi:hypothetical protein